MAYGCSIIPERDLDHQLNLLLMNPTNSVFRSRTPVDKRYQARSGAGRRQGVILAFLCSADAV